MKKITCHDCGKEILTKKDNELIKAKQLQYKYGEQKIMVFKCDTCFERNKGLQNFQECEVYSRIVGYLRPIKQWNDGKQQEFKERTPYKNICDSSEGCS